MKLLIISHHIGSNASGIVAERFVAELAKRNEVDVCTCDYRPSQPIDCRNLIRVNYPIRHPGLYRRCKKLGMVLFRTDIVDELLKKKVVTHGKKYDAVLGFCYGNSLFGLIAGLYARTYYGCKLACYLLDPIPSPIGWSQDVIFRRRLLSFVSRRLSEADYIASSNPQMLVYQLGLFNAAPTSVTETIYTPCKEDRLRKIPYKPVGNRFSFVYTGNIYGLRSARHIVRAFSRLASEYDSVELILVGNINPAGYRLEWADPPVRPRIRTIPYVADLTPYYETAGALIDIDAELPGDVFLSSKMVNYLTMDRPIICQTGPRSPSRSLFGAIPSIIQCDHDPEEIYRAMKEVLRSRNMYDFRDRSDLIHELSVANQAQRLQKSMEQLIMCN